MGDDEKVRERRVALAVLAGAMENAFRFRVGDEVVYGTDLKSLADERMNNAKAVSKWDRLGSPNRVFMVVGRAVIQRGESVMLTYLVDAPDATGLGWADEVALAPASEAREVLAQWARERDGEL